MTTKHQQRLRHVKKKPKAVQLEGKPVTEKHYAKTRRWRAWKEGKMKEKEIEKETEE